MTPYSTIGVCLILLSAGAASAAGAGTFGSSQGTWRSSASTSGMNAPRPPNPPASPSYRPPANNDGGFKPWKPSVRVDSTRGGVDAYPGAKKPKGYISPY